jgi:hypothetical protein
MHDPGEVAQLIAVAVEHRSALVYGHPIEATPHSLWRNLTSRVAKRLAEAIFGIGGASAYSSFRLVQGEIARGTAAYATYGQYLDVALGWFTERVTVAHVNFRRQVDEDRPSAYGLRRLLHHFRMLILSSGPRPLRIIGTLGIIAAVGGFVLSAALIVLQIANKIDVPGWTSLAVVTLTVGGLTLLALAVLAEYVGLAVGLLLGRPAFLQLSRPSTGVGRE